MVAEGDQRDRRMVEAGDGLFKLPTGGRLGCTRLE